MRGQKVEKGQKSQYPAQAVLLSQLPEFCGNDFDAGDRRVSETASEYSETGKVEHPGNSTTWLTVGINHHLVYVVNQIAEVRAA